MTQEPRKDGREELIKEIERSIETVFEYIQRKLDEER